MTFGDFGRHGTNPNPLRTFALTKHSPLIGRDASQPGQWANFDYYHRKSPKRVDNPGGHAPHRGPPNGPFGPTLFSPQNWWITRGGEGVAYIYRYIYIYTYIWSPPVIYLRLFSLCITRRKHRKYQCFCCSQKLRYPPKTVSQNRWFGA